MGDFLCHCELCPFSKLSLKAAGLSEVMIRESPATSGPGTALTCPRVPSGPHLGKHVQFLDGRAHGAHGVGFHAGGGAVRGHAHHGDGHVPASGSYRHQHSSHAGHKQGSSRPHGGPGPQHHHHHHHQHHQRSGAPQMTPQQRVLPKQPPQPRQHGVGGAYFSSSSSSAMSRIKNFLTVPKPHFGRPVLNSKWQMLLTLFL